MDNDKLFSIVKNWKINLTPEYRGFRCANCQRHIHKAWHYNLGTKGFHTPVHLCTICKKKLNLVNNLNIKYREFTCDRCNKPKRRMYHIWNKKGKIRNEVHLCKSCYKND